MPISVLMEIFTLNRFMCKKKSKHFLSFNNTSIIGIEAKLLLLITLTYFVDQTEHNYCIFL